ncbi:MAG: hotdog domain-containing protein, partial [Candidatus Bathyarchaeia archaeon]
SANSCEQVAYALDMNVTYHRPPIKHANLIAESRLVSKTKRTALFFITVKQGDELIATCKALASIRRERIPFREPVSV